MADTADEYQQQRARLVRSIEQNVSETSAYLDKDRLGYEQVKTRLLMADAMPVHKKDSDPAAENLLLVIRELVAEVHPQRPSTEIIGLDSRFEKDLGLDSLTRVELIARVERYFELALPECSFAEVETARDLLRAIQGAEAPRTVLTHSVIKAVPLGQAETAPAEAQTLLEVLNWHVEQHPERPHIQLYQDEGEGENLNYQQLKTGAEKVAAGLQQAGLQPAEPIVIMLPGDADYFYSFFGILMAGGIPVPVYPPARPSQLEDHMLRHARILANCLAITLITVPEARQVARLLKAHVPGLKHIVTVSELMTSSVVVTPPTLGSNDIAFLQYTSGSTGNPKGVALTHANLLANIRAMGQAIKVSSKDVFVSWLPLYHDMGLIGAWLGSLYYAMLLVVIPPLSFLARPERWLWTIHRYRGTLSASPNFGYEYCLKRLKDEDLEGMDLSCWRAAFNGAETISPGRSVLSEKQNWQKPLSFANHWKTFTLNLLNVSTSARVSATAGTFPIAARPATIRS